jgi:sec-independent protein translocase protein TatB
MMNRMSFSETIFLFFLALIIFGPKKLPEIARQVGKVLNEFRRASNEFKVQIEQEIAHLDVVENKKQTILPPSPAPEGTASRTLNAAPSEPYPSSATPAEAGTTGTGAVEAPATVASDDEPLFATATASPTASAAEPPAATEESASPTTEAVTASASQESHA